jgi:hypothetical protein
LLWEKHSSAISSTCLDNSAYLPSSQERWGLFLDREDAFDAARSCPYFDWRNGLESDPFKVAKAAVLPAPVVESSPATNGDMQFCKRCDEAAMRLQERALTVIDKLHNKYEPSTPQGMWKWKWHQGGLAYQTELSKDAMEREALGISLDDEGQEGAPLLWVNDISLYQQLVSSALLRILYMTTYLFCGYVALRYVFVCQVGMVSLLNNIRFDWHDDRHHVHPHPRITTTTISASNVEDYYQHDFEELCQGFGIGLFGVGCMIILGALAFPQLSTDSHEAKEVSAVEKVEDAEDGGQDGEENGEENGEEGSEEGSEDNSSDRNEEAHGAGGEGAAQMRPNTAFAMLTLALAVVCYAFALRLQPVLERMLL